MKMFPKTQDHAIDRLLRAQGGRPGDKPPQCRTFDPDLANAYVERSLTANEIAGYEQHLAACSPCRKAIVVLTRMAAADLAATTPGKAAAIAQVSGESRLRRLLSALTVPQWAMAATAVIALAIALPLTLSHRSTSSNQSDRTVATYNAGSPPSAPEQTARAGAPETSPIDVTASNAPATSPREPGAANPTPATASERTVAVADTKKESAAAASAVGAGAAEAPAAATKPVESKPVADDAVAKTSDQPQPTPPATQPAAGEAPLPKIDPSKAKQLPADKDTASTTIRPGQTDGAAERDKVATAVQADSIAPPPVRGPRTESERRDHGNRVAAGGASAFRGSSEEAAPAPRGEPRKVANHVFFLRGDVWTDKDYNPHKEMPIVTLIRDSEVYNSLVAKDEKLKRLLTGFGAHDQCVVVYKGVAYKVKPQNSDQ